MKIAFVYSGLIRNLKDVGVQHREIISRLNADVYGSFWDVNDSEDSFDNLEYFNKLFKPILSEQENLESWKKSICFEEILKEALPNNFYVKFSQKFIDQHKDFRSLSMWYKVWRANYLCNSSGHDYDVIVRLRTDINFTRGFFPSINKFLNIPSGFVITEGEKDMFGPHDFLAYGKTDLMNYYCSLYFRISEYIKMGELVIQPENLLRVHLSQKHIPILLFVDDIHIVRLNGGNVDTEPPGVLYYHDSLDWIRN